MDEKPKALTPAEQIANAVGFYGAGIICPAIVWDMVADAIGENDACAILDSCVPGTQHHLRAIFRERAWNPRPERPELYAAINDWCLRK